MHKWASTSAKSVLMAAGFVALGSGVAFADTDAATSGNGSVLGGNQAVANADIPVNLSGNAVSAILGTSGASTTDTGAAVVDHHHNEVATSGNGSVLGGNQLVVDGDVPVNVTGNAIGAVGGVAGAAATDTGALVAHGHHGHHGHDGHDGDEHEHDRQQGHEGHDGYDVEHQGHSHDDHDHEPDVATSGNGSILGGNQLVADLDVPVNVSGNAIGAVGGVAGAAATDTGALVYNGGGREHQSASADYTVEELLGEAVSNVSLLPDTSGVDAGILRQSAPREHQSAATSGNGSALGGNQLVAHLDVPVNLSGNAIGAVGGVAGAAATDTGALVLEKEPEVATSGNGSLVGGNQLVAHGDVPVNATGNAVAAVASLAGASSTDTGAAVVHQSATEHQAGALDAAPVVRDLPEIPVSQMLPVDYTLSETTAQAVREHAPEHADELPEAAPSVDVVGELLGAAGIGL
ncbi:hypothetical protein Q8791_03485 [Nocardiopsis sp. CT-R113]|uniref:Chaplin domain-containing protein n=1 Tax=Nocardiopsis codii TaxID=3065942 RepID=A0ABU7K404_9ACTN|nr:hypothetical protein [Nocardiopsis sp. CT-R113]MEE2036282.1 hypothetical protein [Nocardiopsis sp. CT-R113]